MHPNPVFRQVSTQRNLAFAKKRGFGVLSINAQAGPLLAHVPFLLSEQGDLAELHLVRSNPIARALTDPTPAVIAVWGADSYVSPDWYDAPDQVPTWNYVAVHLRGTLAPCPAEDLHPMLDRLAAHFEAALLPKPPWLSSKMSDGVMARMMRMIAPFQMRITGVQGTWKLGQNKPHAARLGAADRIETAGIGYGLSELAALMRDPPAEGD